LVLPLRHEFLAHNVIVKGYHPNERDL
jgi:hypothetical protein